MNYKRLLRNFSLIFLMFFVPICFVFADEQQVIEKANSVLKEIQDKLQSDNVERISCTVCKSLQCEEIEISSPLRERVLKTITELIYKDYIHNESTTRLGKGFGREEALVFSLQKQEKFELNFSSKQVTVDYYTGRDITPHFKDYYQFRYVSDSYPEIVKEIDQYCAAQNSWNENSVSTEVK